MAFQPFQLPSSLGMNRSMDFMSNALTEAMRARRENEQTAAENLRYAGQQKRQGQLDSQAAYLKAQELLKAGDVEGAKVILAPFMEGGGFTPAQPVGAAPGPGPAAIQAPAGPAPGPNDELLAHHAGQGAGQQGAPAAMATNPLTAAYQAQHAKNQQMAQVFKGRMNGQEITLDPEAHQRQQEEARSALSQQWQNSGVDPKHLQFATSLLSMGVDPAKVGNLVGGMIEKEAAITGAGANVDKRIGAASALEGQRQTGHLALEGQRQTGRLALEDKQQGGGKYKHGAGAGDGSGGASYNPKVERNNKAAVSALDTSVNRFAKASGLEALTKSHEEAERAMESLNTGNPAGMAHALEKFVSVSRGGMATNAALNLFQKHLSGLGGTVEGAIENLRSGSLGPEQVKNLHAALAQVQHSIKEQVEIKRQAFVRDYVASPAYAELKGNAEDAYDRLFSPFGYQTQYDPNAKVIALGTGQRAAASGRPSGAPATEHAAATPKDKAAIEWAQAHSGDPRAAKILKLHGM